jgi:hypothetical protein
VAAASGAVVSGRGDRGRCGRGCACRRGARAEQAGGQHACGGDPPGDGRTWNSDHCFCSFVSSDLVVALARVGDPNSQKSSMRFEFSPAENYLRPARDKQFDPKWSRKYPLKDHRK